MKKLNKVLRYALSAIIGMIALGVLTTQVNAETTNEGTSTRVAVWTEARSARVSNYNRYVQFESEADCYGNGNVVLTYTKIHHFELLTVTSWNLQKFGSDYCWGSLFNAYDMSEGFDLIGGILGNCYGSSCTCPYSPNPYAPRDCSC